MPADLVGTPADVAGAGNARLWKYKVSFPPGAPAADGERWGLDFPKGTQIRNPREFDPPLATPTSNISTDGEGKVIVWQRVTKAEAAAGSFTIEVLAAGGASEQKLSVERGLARGGWLAVETEAKASAATPIALAPHPGGEELAFLARYEGLKLAELLSFVAERPAPAGNGVPATMPTAPVHPRREQTRPDREESR